MRRTRRDIHRLPMDRTTSSLLFLFLKDTLDFPIFVEKHSPTLAINCRICANLSGDAKQIIHPLIAAMRNALPRLLAMLTPLEHRMNMEYLEEIDRIMHEEWEDRGRELWQEMNIVKRRYTEEGDF